MNHPDRGRTRHYQKAPKTVSDYDPNSQTAKTTQPTLFAGLFLRLRRSVLQDRDGPDPNAACRPIERLNAEKHRNSGIRRGHRTTMLLISTNAPLRGDVMHALSRPQI